MLYKINRFSLEEHDSTGLVNLFTPNSAVIVTDKNMLSFLSKIENEMGQIGEQTLHARLASHGLAIQDAVDFLTVHSGVMTLVQESPTIAIYSDDPEIAATMTAHLSNTDPNVFISTSTLEDVNADILIAVQSRYSHLRSHEILETAIAARNRVLINSYFIYRHFIIDSLYTVDAGTPCHFCCFEQYIAESEQLASTPSTWAELLIGLSQKVDRQHNTPTLPRTPVETSAAIYLLASYMRPLWNRSAGSIYHEDASRIIELNIDTGKVTRNQAVHSQICGCARHLSKITSPS